MNKKLIKRTISAYIFQFGIRICDGTDCIYYLQVSAIHFYLYKMNINTDNKYHPIKFGNSFQGELSACFKITLFMKRSSLSQDVGLTLGAVSE
jgi:hypothetical protein